MNMNQYNIYCSEEQTIRALKLGAPVEDKCIKPREFNPHEWLHIVNYPPDKVECEGGIIYNIPTTEQMCGWLLDKGVYAHVGTDAYVRNSWESYIQVAAVAEGKEGKEFWWLEPESYKIFVTYTEAMMHAIDAALSYLEKEEK